MSTITESTATTAGGGATSLASPATSSAPVDPARVIVNPVIGDRMTFLTNTADSGGEHLLLEIELVPGGSNPLHWHRKQTENFEVVRGRLGLHRAGERLILGPGERASVPQGIAHGFFNPTDEPAVFRVDLRPALHFERAIRSIYGLMRDGLMPPDPKEFMRRHPFLAAMVMQDSDMRTPELPLVVQDVLLPVLEALGRLTGAERVVARYQ